MSYPRLVVYAHHPQAESKKFSDKIIFFDIERGTTEMADRCRVINRHYVFFMNDRAFVRLPDAVRYHVERAFRRNFPTLYLARRTIFDFCDAPSDRQH